MNENQVPTPQEALQILDRATAQFQGTRVDHVKIQQSLEVLVGVVAKASANEEDATTQDSQDEPAKNPESGESESSESDEPQSE